MFYKNKLTTYSTYDIVRPNTDSTNKVIDF